MSEKPRRKWDRWTAEFRQRILERMKTSRNVKALPTELGVAPQQLYSPVSRQVPPENGSQICAHSPHKALFAVASRALAGSGNCLETSNN
jgi:transposase-like protein